MSRKLFCEISPTCYEISRRKEILKRNLKDFFSSVKIAKNHSDEALPVIVKGHSSVLLRKLNGVDMELQQNKVFNIQIACDKINGIIVRPGETFSFWRMVGEPKEKYGFRKGMVIKGSQVSSGIGGGLCQMANMIHWLVLNSPLDVTELHHHSDALFPDERRRVPFGTGTSVYYNNVDYRFTNNTKQDVQILVWIENGELCGELRTTEPFRYRYKLTEENNHFSLENGEYYRISQVYRIVIDKSKNEEIRKELILDNHSKVMYDYSLIPKEQIW